MVIPLDLGDCETKLNEINIMMTEILNHKIVKGSAGKTKFIQKLSILFVKYIFRTIFVGFHW